MTDGSFSFPKARRIRRRGDFVSIQRSGFKISAECVLALVRKQQDPGVSSRLGLTVSSKVGNAVVRSTVRRRCREIFRSRAAFPKGFDVVLIAKTVAATADFQSFVRSFDTIEAMLRTRFR
jgi:ribonuclease P protein component